MLRCAKAAMQWYCTTMRAGRYKTACLEARKACKAQVNSSTTGREMLQTHAALPHNNTRCCYHVMHASTCCHVRRAAKIIGIDTYTHKRYKSTHLHAICHFICLYAYIRYYALRINVYIIYIYRYEGRMQWRRFAVTFYAFLNCFCFIHLLSMLNKPSHAVNGRKTYVDENIGRKNRR